MADVNISMMLADQGNSIKKRTGETKELNTELTKTQRLARSAFSASSGMAPPGQQVEDYGRGRAAIGTGAAGRDFANQAQGLGGLVRVYATFAANLFAVSAAFNALKNAADTTNLIKGLEQLGTASGVNLPKVAKDLEAASGGAISLRDAMTATAQASSAGMSGENIKRMGDVARNASQALGVDMSNALDRLTRGITKLEPELLDEIGIFTRTEQASDEYARQLGKTVSSLTSFEKRQAFANAVLAEGEQKFSAIALETNPYNKLLASLKNLSQAGLELVNKVLGPIIDFLSKSPTALAAVLGLIGTSLLKQAIPALTQWKAELQDGVERTSSLAKQNLELFRNYQQDIARQTSQNISQTVRDNAEIAKTGWESQQESTKKSVLKNNKELRGLMRQDLEQASQQDLQILDRIRQQYEKAAGASYQDPGRQQAAQARLAEFQRQEPEIRKLIQAQLDYNSAIEQATPRNLTLHGKLLQTIANNADDAERKMRILANAADNAAFSGPISAMRAMHGAIQRLPSSIGLASKAMLYFKGTVTVAAVTIGTFTSAMGNLLGTIGIITGVGMLLGSFLSKNADEAAKASQSIDALKSSGDNLDRVLESISKKTPLQQLTADSLAASSTALKDLSSAINQAIKDTDSTIAARGWWDNFTNNLASAVGKSDEQILEKTITKQLTKILEATEKSPGLKSVRDRIASTVGLASSASAGEIVKAFGQDPRRFGKDLNAIFVEFNNVNQSAKAINTTFDELTKKFRDLKTELSQKGNIVDIVTLSNTAFSDLSKIIDGPIFTSLSGMQSLLKNVEGLSVIPETVRNTLIAMKPAIDNLSMSMQENETSILNNTSALATYKQKIVEAQNLINQASGRDVQMYRLAQFSPTGAPATAKEIRAYYEELARAAEKAIEDSQRNISQNRGIWEQYKNSVKQATEAGFLASSNILQTLFSTAIKKSMVEGQQTALSKLPETEETIKRAYTLSVQQIELDKKQQIVQQQLIIEQEKTRLQLEKNRLTTEKNTIALTESNPEIRKGLMQPLQQRIEAIEGRRDETGKLIQPGMEQALQAISRGYLDAATLRSRFGMDMQQAESFSKLSGGMGQTSQLARQREAGAVLERDVRLEVLRITNRSAELNREIEQARIKILELERTLIGGATGVVAADIAQQIRQQSDIISRKTEEQAKLPAEQQAAITRLAGPRAGLTQDEIQSIVTKVLKDQGLISEKAGAERQTGAARTANEIINLLDESGEYYRRADITISSQLDTLQETSRELQSQTGFEKKSLEIKLESGKISIDTYNRQIRLLEEQETLRIRDLELSIAKIEYERDYQNLVKDYINKSKSQGGALTEEQEKTFTAESRSLDDRYNRTVNRITGVYDQTKKINDMMQILTDRQKSYSDIFSQTFDRMADSIVQFVQTGKLNFKELINSMLADLLRYELKLQMMDLYKSLRPGLMNIVGSLFGGTGGTPGYIPGLAGPDFPSYMAMGGAFEDGIRKYAKGGMFTNSIVDSPTLFKFAKGTGMMGEAGPEAIMPLKRDSQGNLGVRGGGGSVEVVVNNYSTEKAEARETTDSRGNRRIEVVVGDMAAGEITRNGSSTQRAIGGTFGLQPQLIRR
jgi:hypothetical protein